MKGCLEELAGDASEAERRRRLQTQLVHRLDAQGRSKGSGAWLRAAFLTPTNVQRVNWEVLQGALDLRRLHQLSHWDAAILAAAQLSGCSLVLSEDLSDGGRYGAVEVPHPFR